MSQNILMHPIGIFSSQAIEKYSLPRQASEDLENTGVIHLEAGYNYEQALEDLASFPRIWLIYHFHANTNWKPKVMPPRGGIKRGLFATRSPHRPNPIGMSCVKLLSIDKRSLTIQHHDLLDGTPILDIKPYLAYADSYAESSHGWLEDCMHEKSFLIEWSKEAKEEADFLLAEAVDFMGDLELTLKDNPFPYPSRRIEKCTDGSFILSLKTWRFHYTVDHSEYKVCILSIRSGYDKATIAGEKCSRWDDLPIHQKFLSRSTHSRPS